MIESLTYGAGRVLEIREFSLLSPSVVQILPSEILKHCGKEDGTQRDTQTLWQGGRDTVRYSNTVARRTGHSEILKHCGKKDGTQCGNVARTHITLGTAYLSSLTSLPPQ